MKLKKYWICEILNLRNKYKNFFSTDFSKIIQSSLFYPQGIKSLLISVNVKSTEIDWNIC